MVSAPLGQSTSDIGYHRDQWGLHRTFSSYKNLMNGVHTFDGGCEMRHFTCMRQVLFGWGVSHDGSVAER